MQRFFKIFYHAKERSDPVNCVLVLWPFFWSLTAFSTGSLMWILDVMAIMTASWHDSVRKSNVKICVSSPKVCHFWKVTDWHVKPRYFSNFFGVISFQANVLPLSLFFSHSCLFLHTRFWIKFHLVRGDWTLGVRFGLNLGDSIIWVCLCFPSHWTMWWPTTRDITNGSTALPTYMTLASTMTTGGTNLWSQHLWERN